MIKIFEQPELDNISDMILSEDKETRNLAAMLLKTKSKFINIGIYTKIILIALFNVGLWILVDLYVKDFRICVSVVLNILCLFSIAEIMEKIDKNKKNN